MSDCVDDDDDDAGSDGDDDDCHTGDSFHMWFMYLCCVPLGVEHMLWEV